MLNNTKNFVLVAAAVLTACGGSGDTSNSTKDNTAPASNTETAQYQDNSKVLATVNGKKITRNMYDAHLRQRQSQGSTIHNQQNYERTLKEMIDFELLKQDAEKKNLHKEVDVATLLDLQRKYILGSAAFSAYLKDNPLTDDEMKKDYEERMSRIDILEYRLRHTLNDKEADAKAVIAELEKGTGFADAAKKLSSGPSAAEGGDLGWLGPQDMVPGFREAAQKLEKGKYSAPVKTQFGWHVIYLEDTRKVAAPPFEDVRKEVKIELQRKQVDDYLISLRQQASIEIQGQDAPKPPVASGKTADPNRGGKLKSEINIDNSY